MRIALGSIFRNSTGSLERYFRQVEALAVQLRSRGDTLRLILAEGDSIDGTYDELHYHLDSREGAINMHDSKLIQVNHGGPVFGSVNDEQRWRNISKVCNDLLDLVTPQDDILIYVESDLIWQPVSMTALIDLAELSRFDVVVPMCLAEGTDRFYDIWGHRRRGLGFRPEPPYHPDLELHRGYTALGMDSAGSCLVMKGHVALNTRFDPPEHGIVGWCEDIRRKGYSIWLQPAVKVEHPI